MLYTCVGIFITICIFSICLYRDSQKSSDDEFQKLEEELYCSRDSFDDVDKPPTDNFNPARVEPQEEGVQPDGYNPDDWNQKRID